jgi:hypothetical protein
LSIAALPPDAGKALPYRLWRRIVFANEKNDTVRKPQAFRTSGGKAAGDAATKILSEIISPAS